MSKSSMVIFLRRIQKNSLSICLYLKKVQNGQLKTYFADEAEDEATHSLPGPKSDNSINAKISQGIPSQAIRNNPDDDNKIWLDLEFKLCVHLGRHCYLWRQVCPALPVASPGHAGAQPPWGLWTNIKNKHNQNTVRRITHDWYWNGRPKQTTQGVKPLKPYRSLMTSWVIIFLVLLMGDKIHANINLQAHLLGFPQTKASQCAYPISEV